MEHTDPITLMRYLLSEPVITKDNDLEMVFNAIGLACKVTSHAVRRAGITGLYGLDGATNASGDDVKKLDIMSNTIFINSLKYCKRIALMVSEEEEEAIIVDDPEAKFVIAFDPLDGSSNIDCNVSTGTIFAIYRKISTGPVSPRDILRPGTELLAAGYCMYGSATQLVITVKNGVHGFTLDPTIGEFILSHPNIKIPSNPKKIYSVNEGNYANWDEPTKAFVEECKAAKSPYSARYVGSMVSDVNRTLMYGGIFMYPADKKSKDGKLRLLYEANPMSLIMEEAGGVATTGTQRVLDIVPKSIHERAPVFLGCKRDVDRVIQLFREKSGQ